MKYTDEQIIKFITFKRGDDMIITLCGIDILRDYISVLYKYKKDNMVHFKHGVFTYIDMDKYFLRQRIIKIKKIKKCIQMDN